MTPRRHLNPEKKKKTQTPLEKKNETAALIPSIERRVSRKRERKYRKAMPAPNL